MSPYEQWLPHIRSNPKEWLAPIIRAGDDDPLALELLREHPNLLEHRFTGNATPLLLAAYSEQWQIADALLEMGAKMDFITAIALRRLESVRAMLEAQPWLIGKHAGSWSALHVAARYSTPEIVALLILAGAVVDSPDKRRMTPLFNAVQPPFDNARLLLEHGASINARAKHGFTPLHCAIGGRDAGWVRFLIAHGANPELRTDARQTPWSLAVRRGYREIAAILEQS